MLTASAAAKWLPREFVEASSTGGVYTLLAYVLMLVLFVCELWGFAAESHSTVLSLDRSGSDSLQINFDVDLYDLECRNLKVVVWSQTGEERISSWAQDFWLRPVDSKGRTYGMAIKPSDVTPGVEEGEAAHRQLMSRLVKEDGKEELDADWASSHDGFKHQSFDHVIQAHDFTMVNFFAGWCGHCQVFAPAWNEMAKKVNGEAGPPLQFPDKDNIMRSVRMIRMNCVDFKQLCWERGIDAYPTLRLYKADGSFSVFDGKRDEAEIFRWIERTIKLKSYGWATNHEAFERGCNAKGRIEVPRVPGHLMLMAGAGDQNLNPRMTNVSHLVKHLSFSDPDDGKQHRKAWAGLPREVAANLNPIDGKRFVAQQFHETYIHDMKVVSTVSTGGRTSYQIRHQERLSKVPEDDIPQAKFEYDIEPFSIHIKREEKKWYDLATSLLALLGGCFVVMRLASRASLATMSFMKHLLPRSGGSARAGHMNIGHLQ